jgi:WXG100 family type VII secretion target
MAVSPSDRISVQPDLEVAGSRLNQQAQDIADELHALASYLDGLAEIWTGSAAGYYQGLQQEWNTAADGLFGPDGVLGTIAAALDANWANYSEAEWNNSQTWHGGSKGA